MQLYRVRWTEEEPTAANSEWVNTAVEAKKSARENRGSYEVVNVPTKKAELLEFLNKNCWRA